MGVIKRFALSCFDRVARSESGARILRDVTRTTSVLAPPKVFHGGLAQPYAELPCGRPSDASLRDDIIFVTARFRSGSTLLWNLLRHVPGITSYYEPFNERRWFDPDRRGSRVDPTHRQVDDYWREYEGLGELGQWYDEEWTRSRLYMDEAAWAPEMKRFIDVLVERASGRPALQFNRVDFRLPWLRQHFPNAKIIHLYRHPRDQWCSCLGHKRTFDPSGRMADFAAYDGYYLLPWARDLQDQFPFLRPELHNHPYELFYLIWRMSYLFGQSFACHSICFERLLENPEAELAKLFSTLGGTMPDIAPLKSLISPPSTGGWRRYAPEGWFLEKEQSCERIVADFAAGCRTKPFRNDECH